MLKDIEIIRKKLKEEGYTNQLINYQKFLELYEPYKKEMKESDFAEILGISYSHYYNVKRGKNKARILKFVEKIEEERKKEIRQALSVDGYADRLIDYEKFLELYEPYKEEIKEIEFAEILGISYSHYYHMKSGRKKARTLELSEERKEKIKRALRKDGYADMLIDYEKFLELYEPYKEEIGEKKFAEILEISYYNYWSIKNKGKRTRILKKEETVSEERKEEIRIKLKEKEGTNKLINYKEFLELYKPYKEEMNEKEFAEILEISYSNYNNIKYKGTRARILKKEKTVSEERKREIRAELKERGNTNKLINYEGFLELYEPYKKEINEKVFAEIIGILYGNYDNLKNNVTKAIILKKEETVSEETEEEIRRNIKEKGYSSKLVSYEEFLELYQLYGKELKERVFAQIIGITYVNYITMRYGKTRTRIVFNYKELSRIKYQLSLESREYRKEELEKKCQQYGVTLYELLSYLYPNLDIDILINKESIYIGTCPMPEIFLKKYSEEILLAARRLSSIICKRYRLGCYREDVASEVLLYVIEKKGSLVKNSKTDEEALEVIRKFMAVVIKYKYIDMCKVKRILSLDEPVPSNGKLMMRYETIKAPEVPIQLDEKYEENILGDMKSCYEKGLENTEAIEYVMKKYKITNKEELLKILEKELSKKRKIMKTSTGQIYLGEEIEIS